MPLRTRLLNLGFEIVDKKACIEYLYPSVMFDAWPLILSFFALEYRVLYKILTM